VTCSLRPLTYNERKKFRRDKYFFQILFFRTLLSDLSMVTLHAKPRACEENGEKQQMSIKNLKLWENKFGLTDLSDHEQKEFNGGMFMSVISLF